MQKESTVEIADRVSRKRAIGVAAAAGAFLVIQVIARPFFLGVAAVPHPRMEAWAINAIVLLALLATGGGLINRREIRSLVNDEVARSNYKSAVNVGYWVAMVVAMAVYFVPGLDNRPAREAVYLIVTPSIGIAL